MDSVDIALFDYDRNNTLYFFLMNADEQIYMRYGGRDSASPDTYLSLDSLAVAAEKGLELHEAYKAGKLAKTERPKPSYPREYPLLVKRTFSQNACVECHLIGDFQNLHREQDGTLDKLVHLFRSPDLKTLGIHLDVPKGLVVKEAKGAALAAGMRAGDRIATWDGDAVWTFADVQYRYDKVARNAKSLKVGVVRDGAPALLTVALPDRWWYTDTRFRQSSVEPRLYFEDVPLGAEEKIALGVSADSFASRVKFVSTMAKTFGAHQLETGDVILGVNGKQSDGISHTASLHLVLLLKPGDGAEMEVLRNGQRIRLPLQTNRMSFRK